ncbi:hypothetical protein MMH89_01080 [Candidatus Comchoanobacter bicostacola]|uniref:Autotransporter domain-containing protein n=1 Tax=Candidatus Comchoanobacter bicostacola TaxID=2919598 RepID=A0ABY5DKD7_9GAMM|nr:hypothetical protein [Candidatus Comchoanobacter bicostacola]UTC24749.1 hypothetical protein MMH89_01080 [Candidatus Comchoanobacter bicostacola]
MKENPIWKWGLITLLYFSANNGIAKTTINFYGKINQTKLNSRATIKQGFDNFGSIKFWTDTSIEQYGTFAGVYGDHPIARAPGSVFEDRKRGFNILVTGTERTPEASDFVSGKDILILSDASATTTKSGTFIKNLNLNIDSASTYLRLSTEEGTISESSITIDHSLNQGLHVNQHYNRAKGEDESEVYNVTDTYYSGPATITRITPATAENGTITYNTGPDDTYPEVKVDDVLNNDNAFASGLDGGNYKAAALNGDASGIILTPLVEGSYVALNTNPPEYFELSEENQKKDFVFIRSADFNNDTQLSYILKQAASFTYNTPTSSYTYTDYDTVNYYSVDLGLNLRQYLAQETFIQFDLGLDSPIENPEHTGFYYKIKPELTFHGSVGLGANILGAHISLSQGITYLVASTEVKSLATSDINGTVEIESQSLNITRETQAGFFHTHTALQASFKVSDHASALINYSLTNKNEKQELKGAQSNLATSEIQSFSIGIISSLDEEFFL